MKSIYVSEVCNSITRNLTKRILKRTLPKRFLSLVSFLILLLLIVPDNLKSQWLNTSGIKDKSHSLKGDNLLENRINLKPVQKKSVAELYFNTGISFPISPEEFSDYWSLGYNFGGGVGFPISEIFSLRGLLDYNSFSFDEDTFLKDLGASGSGATVDGLSASVFTFTLNAKSFFSSTPATVSPYTTLGLGYFNLTLSDVTVSYQGLSQTAEFGSESGFTMIFGGGVDINVGSLDIFLELDYGACFTKGESTYYLPVKTGVKIGL